MRLQPLARRSDSGRPVAALATDEGFIEFATVMSRKAFLQCRKLGRECPPGARETSNATGTTTDSSMAAISSHSAVCAEKWSLRVLQDATWPSDKTRPFWHGQRVGVM